MRFLSHVKNYSVPHFVRRWGFNALMDEGRGIQISTSCWNKSQITATYEFGCGPVPKFAFDRSGHIPLKIGIKFSWLLKMIHISFSSFSNWLFCLVSRECLFLQTEHINGRYSYRSSNHHPLFSKDSYHPTIPWSFCSVYQNLYSSPRVRLALMGAWVLIWKSHIRSWILDHTASHCPKHTSGNHILPILYRTWM